MTDTEQGAFRIGQKALLAVDRILAGFCIAVIPAFLALFASGRELPTEAKPWAIATVLINIPALFTLLWHSFRWPARLQHMHDAVREACEALSRDMIHILENVARPKTEEAIYGKHGDKIIRDKDGKEYIEGPWDSVMQRMRATLIEHLAPDNRIVANTISARSAKIYEVQKHARIGRLPEGGAALKQWIDLFSRYARHLLFAAVLVSATMCVVKLIRY